MGRVLVRDIAEVSIGYKKAQSRLRVLNEPALAFNITREQGANVIKTMAEVRAAIKGLADGPVKRQGLVLEQVYDETDYIDASIDLVQTNIIYGGVLAIIILMIFFTVMASDGGSGYLYPSIRCWLVCCDGDPRSILERY